MAFAPHPGSAAKRGRWIGGADKVRGDETEGALRQRLQRLAGSNLRGHPIKNARRGPFIGPATGAKGPWTSNPSPIWGRAPDTRQS